MPAPVSDPRPIPPARPLPGDCCNSGCERCVMVVYEEQMQAYREALREWERRQCGLKSSKSRRPGRK